MVSRKHVIRAVAGLVLMGTLCGGSPTLGGDGQAGVVFNSGFETRQGQESDPIGWQATRVAQMQEFVSLGWDDRVFRSGRRSVFIAVAENHPEDQIFYNWNQAPLDCKPGETYEITGWVKTRELTESAFIAVQCWSHQMKEVLGYANTEPEAKVIGTTDWVQVSATIEIPQETWRVVILAGLPGHSNRGGKVWFDDVQVVRITGK